MVDGEWHELETRTEVIRVKGQADKVLQIKKTHRGSMIPYEVLKKNSAVLFGGEAPLLQNPGKYSFAWHGQYVGE